VLLWRTSLIKFKSERITVLNQPVGHSVKSNSVDLQAKPKPRLGNAATGFKFVSERFKVRNHVRVDLRRKASHNPSEEDSAKAWGWLAGEMAGSKCDPSGGRVRSRAEDLKFSQCHHGARVSPYLSEDPVGRGRGSIVSPHD
jgi:hypothetical protein